LRLEVPEAMTSFKSKGPGKPEEPEKKTGRVTFDDRGQAIWEWSMTTGRFETATTSTRLKKLTNVELSLIDDAPPPDAGKVMPNPSGTKQGYDPYDSGRLSRTDTQKPIKKDLRKLDEWIKLKKGAAKSKDE
jgi:hypothetical protein